MASLRALSRNAGRRLCRVFSAARIHSQARHHNLIPSCSSTRSSRMGFKREQLLAQPSWASRGCASQAAGGEEEQFDEAGDGDLEDDGADEEINLNYLLSEKEEEACNRLLKALFSHHPTTSPVRIVNDWIKDGNTLSQPMLIKVFRKLQAGKRAAQARRLMTLVLKEKLVEATDKINLLAILSAQRTRMMSVARSIYDNLPKTSRTPAICTAMVVGYAKNDDPNSAEQILNTFTPKTAQAFNTLILMHLRLGDRKKAIETFDRMRKAGVKPNKITLHTLMKNKPRLGIEVEKQEAEAILNSGIDDLKNNRRQLYSVKNSILTYAYMGDAENVEKLWSELQQVEALPTFFSSMAVEAFGVLKRVDKIEEIVGSLSEKQKREQAFYPALVRAYARNDELSKAEEVVKHVREGQESGETRLSYQIYDELIEAHLERGNQEIALEKIKEARENVKNKRTGAGFETVRKLLRICASKEDVESAEELVKSTPRLSTEAYNELLKVYQAAKKKPEGNFVERMVKDRVKPDEKTRRLLAKMGKHDQVMW